MAREEREEEKEGKGELTGEGSGGEQRKECGDRLHDGREEERVKKGGEK